MMTGRRQSRFYLGAVPFPFFSFFSWWLLLMIMFMLDGRVYIAGILTGFLPPLHTSYIITRTSSYACRVCRDVTSNTYPRPYYSSTFATLLANPASHLTTPQRYPPPTRIRNTNTIPDVKRTVTTRTERTRPPPEHNPHAHASIIYSRFGLAWLRRYPEHSDSSQHNLTLDGLLTHTFIIHPDNPTNIVIPHLTHTDIDNWFSKK